MRLVTWLRLWIRDWTINNWRETHSKMLSFYEHIYISVKVILKETLQHNNTRFGLCYSAIPSSPLTHTRHCPLCHVCDSYTAESSMNDSENYQPSHTHTLAFVVPSINSTDRIMRKLCPATTVSGQPLPHPCSITVCFTRTHTYTEKYRCCLHTDTDGQAAETTAHTQSVLATQYGQPGVMTWRFDASVNR